MSNLKANTAKACTIYFDGACPLCAKEIATYQNWQGAERIEWIDASNCAPQDLGRELERTQALAKLHARDQDGVLVSGAAAFVMMWRQMPTLKWITPFLGHTWMIRVLDYLYELFLKVRPIWRKPDH